jgi:hypothetical protein
MKFSLVKSLPCVLVVAMLAAGSAPAFAQSDAPRLQAAPVTPGPTKGPSKLRAPTQRDPAGYSCTMPGHPGWCNCSSIQDCGRLAASGKCKTPIADNPGGDGKSCEI